jgi:uncharacterized membrane protein YebE (DUF533 family)
MFDANKLLTQMFGGGAKDGAKGEGGNPLSDIGGLLGGLFNDSVAGMKAGASAIEQKTGIGEKADDAIKGVTGGKSAGDLIEQAKDFMGKNKLATGAALGGIGALLLGSKGGRGMLGNAAGLGGLAMIGGLAFKAFQDHQAKKAPSVPAHIEAAPDDSPFGHTGDPQKDQDAAVLILRAMIAAAACDGTIDNEERSRIIGGLEKAGLDVYAAKFLDQEFAKPASIAELAAAASTPALASQAYTAARITIEPDRPAEQAFLTALATALKLDPGLVAKIDAAAAAAKG